MKLTYDESLAIGTAKMWKVLGELNQRVGDGGTVTRGEKSQALQLVVSWVNKLTMSDTSIAEVNQLVDESEHFFKTDKAGKTVADTYVPHLETLRARM